MYGKTIELFLVNGSADGLVTAELSNWNGKAIKIPRTEVADCNREDIQGIGVYFLICEEETGTDSVYIGEAENIKERLLQHIRDYRCNKEQFYWHTALLFLGRDLNKALIRYLENRFLEIAKECARFSILTKHTYKNTALKESQIASMEEFIDQVKILADTLGFKVLIPTPIADDKTTYLYCKSSEANAKGFVSSSGFTVLKHSKISDKLAPSFEIQCRPYFNLRNTLIQERIIENGIFIKSYEFSSPSAASSVVLGRSSNGQSEWKTNNRICLKEL